MMKKWNLQDYLSLIMSGLLGIGIGTIWYILNILMQAHWQLKIDISLADLTFWTVAAFFIGVAFNLATYFFQRDDWSLKKQIAINFFVCYFAYFLFELAINSFAFSWLFLFEVTIAFLLMYFIAYGDYFWHLYRDVKRINKRLKKMPKE